MKTIILSINIMLIALGFIHISAKELQNTPAPILTTESSKIITPPEDNAIRKGTHDILVSKDSTAKIGNIINTNTEISNQEEATDKTIKLVHRIINYALSLISFIALIILIFSGIQMIIAGGDDGKYETGKKNIKKIFIAIVGIAISRIVVSFIFWIIKIIGG